MRQLPSNQELHKLLKYYPDTGKLFWKPRGIKYFHNGHNTAAQSMNIWNSRYAGNEVFCGPVKNAKVCIFRSRYSAKQIIKAMGYKPEVPTNVFTPRSKSESGTQNAATGVYWNPQRQTHRAQIFVNGRVRHLGSHSTTQSAIAARKRAERLYWQPTAGAQ